MFRWIFLNPCDVNDLLGVKLEPEQKGFYEEHKHYQDIVLVYAWTKKQALKKLSQCTEIREGYSLYRPESSLKHYLFNAYCRIFYGFSYSDTQWLTDY